MLALALLAPACAGTTAPESGAQAPEFIEPVSTATTNRVPTPTPAAVETEESITPRTLHIWWPEPLASVNDEDAAEVLSAQISGFQNANPDVLIDFRLKAVATVGGQ